MKKFMSFLLVMTLVVASLSTVAFAANGANVTVATVTAEPGETVSLPVTVTGEFANYELYVSAGELTISEFKGVIGNPANGKVSYANAVNVESHTFTVVIEVPADAQPGSFYPVVISGVDFISNADLADQEYSIVNGGIQIAGEPETEPTEAPTEAPHVCEFGAWILTKAPTCTEAGVETRTCACGESETRAVAALGHDWAAEWTVDETNHWHVCTRCGEIADCAAHEGTWQTLKHPTKTEKGLQVQICKVCEYEMDRREIAPTPDDEPTPGKYDFALINGALTGIAVLSAAAFVVLKRKAAK